MRYFIDIRCRRQFEHLRRQFLQGGELAFSSVLSEEIVADALGLIQNWRDRVYTPCLLYTSRRTASSDRMADGIRGAHASKAH